MKKAVICLFAFTLIMSTDVLGNEYIEPNYFDAYSMVLNNNEISINGQNSKTENSCYEYNGCLMIPLNTFFTTAGFKTSIDYENGIFTAKINDIDFYIDNTNNTMSFGQYENRLIIPSVITENECYIAFNDICDVMTYDDINGIVFLYVGDDFGNILENHFKNNQNKKILKMSVNSNDVEFGKEQFFWNTKIYNSNKNLMIPVRSLFETIYTYSVITWDDNYKRADIEFGNTKIQLNYKNEKIYVNSEEIYLSESIELKNGSLYISLNSLREILSLSKYDIYWDKNKGVLYLRI